MSLSAAVVAHPGAKTNATCRYYALWPSYSAMLPFRPQVSYDLDLESPCGQDINDEVRMQSSEHAWSRHDMQDTIHISWSKSWDFDTRSSSAALFLTPVFQTGLRHRLSRLPKDLQRLPDFEVSWTQCGFCTESQDPPVSRPPSLKDPQS